MPRCWITGSILDHMKNKTADPRLILKATAPKPSRSLLYRDRLSLNRGEQAGMFVITMQAPAGYGKTSLLLQWRREALESGAIVAWLTLDEHDDPAGFVRGLAAALNVGSGSGRFVPEPSESGPGYEGELESLTFWLADVASMAVEVKLILDDVHMLPQTTVNTALMYLLLNAPANLGIILASRRSVGLNVVDLIAAGRLLHLQGRDLNFSLEETAELLEANLAERIDKDTCVRLYEMTQGWPLGVQLAMSNLARHGNLRDAVAKYSPGSGDLQHYFLERLVEGLAADVAMFLTEISCLGRVHPELCQAITGNDNSAAFLSHLRDETPIFHDVVSGGWMRIHPIASEFLVEQFERLPPKHRKQLHNRAAHWLADHELFEDAAQQAHLGGNSAFAFDLIERCIYGIIAQGRMSRMLELLQLLPETEITRRPRVRIATAWAMAQSGKHRSATELVGPLLDDLSTATDVRCEAAEIFATAAFFIDDFNGMQRFISPWQESLADQPVLQQIVGTNLIAANELFQGKPENANYQLQHLRHIARSADLGYALGWSDWLSGFAYLWEGQAVLAEGVLRVGLSRAEEASGRRGPIAVMLAATLAAVLWDRKLFDEASMLLAGRLDVLARHAPPDAIIHGYVTAARLADAAGSEGEAHDLLEQLRAIGDTADLPRLCVASLVEEIRMLGLRLQESTCLARLSRLERLVHAEASRWGILQSLVSPQLGIARAYAAIAAHRWDTALPELQAIDTQVRQTRRVREAIQVQLLMALARQQNGEDCSSMIDEAASLAKALGLGRVMADTYPQFGEQAPSSDAGQPPRAAAAAADTQSTQPRVLATALLTPKEAEVLQLLAGNLSNKQIAAALGVGAQTVKWHLKNMFQKLEAGTRQHLLARARMLGILE